MPLVLVDRLDAAIGADFPWGFNPYCSVKTPNSSISEIERMLGLGCGLVTAGGLVGLMVRVGGF